MPKSSKSGKAKATSSLFLAVYQLVLDNKHFQFHQNLIRNNMAFAAHRMEILDHLAFARFAQSDLTKLGATLRSIAKYTEDYFSGTNFTSVQKTRNAEEAIMLNSKECKDLLDAIHMHKEVQRGHFLKISCPHMAALWCDRLGNAEAARCDAFEDALSVVMQAGVFGFPLTPGL